MWLIYSFTKEDTEALRDPRSQRVSEGLGFAVWVRDSNPKRLLSQFTLGVFSTGLSMLVGFFVPSEAAFTNENHGNSTNQVMPGLVGSGEELMGSLQIVPGVDWKM